MHGEPITIPDSRFGEEPGEEPHGNKESGDRVREGVATLQEQHGTIT